MKINQLARKFTSLCMVLVVISTYSMVSLAAPNAAIGEIIVTGKSEGETFVAVNGEPAKSGRTIFSGSTIVTPEAMSAALNLGKGGKLQLAPGTTFTITEIGGSLTAGSITRLGGSGAMVISNLAGESVTLNPGETVNAASNVAASRAQTGPGGIDWWVWAAIGAAAVAVVVIAVAASGDDSTPASPVR